MDKEYYDRLLDLFIQPGWQDMLEDMQHARDAIRIENISSSEEFWRRKGEAEMLDRFLNYEEFIKGAYDDKAL